MSGRVARTSLFVLLTTLVIPSTAAAQLASHLELGWRQWHVREGGLVTPVAGARVDYWCGRFRGMAGGMAALNGSSNVHDATFGITAALPLGRGVGAELFAGVGRDPLAWTSDQSPFALRGRLVAGDVRRGGWIGAARSQMPALRMVRPAQYEASAGSWRSVMGATIAGAMRVRHASAYALVLEDSNGVDPRTCRITDSRIFSRCAMRYSVAEVELAATRRVLGAEVALHGGTRLGASSTVHPSRPWGGVQAAMPLRGQMEIVGALFHYPADLAFELPERGGASLGLRWRSGSRAVRHPAASATNPGRTADHAGTATAERATVHGPLPDGQRILRIMIHGAERVELRGDMTEWQPIALEPIAPHLWEARLAIAPGVYHYVVRTNGGSWRPLAGAPVADDGFGGEVSLLIVSPGAR